MTMKSPLLCAVVLCFLPGCLIEGSPHENVLYMPPGTHMITLKSRDPASGQQVLLDYTITDTALSYYNSTIQELEAGVVLQDADGSRVLHLPSGRRIGVHVQERDVVRLVDAHSNKAMEVDKAGFEGQSMVDIKSQ